MYNKDININGNEVTIENARNISAPCYVGSCNKLNVHNWLHDLPDSIEETDLVEIRFKNTRKDFYKNVNNISLQPGDIVSVEASPGHDTGIVSLTGELVKNQMKRYNYTYDPNTIKKIYRKAKETDIEKWQQAISREHQTMIRSRKISERLKLEMKIGDVEFQGDGTKAIFYYIADERVDFRELIKSLAEEFRIRIEMKQIGARQEAGRIGGIGTCGRELCCSTWLMNFVSVSTNAARDQELSLNPQKLAGQCSKLKCCLNYELSAYHDAQSDFPKVSNPLETEDGLVFHQKTDIFRRLFWFSYDQFVAVNLTPVPVERVKEIQALNAKGIKVKKLNETDDVIIEKLDFQNDLGEDSITRFDNAKKLNFKKKNNRNKKRRTNEPG